jgi:hypothetical protein
MLSGILLSPNARRMDKKREFEGEGGTIRRQEFG